MYESKYIVFKRDEFYDELGRLVSHTFQHPGITIMDFEIHDVAAFRLSDRFTAPAIQAYFDAVSNVLEVLEEFGMPDDNITIEDLTILREWAWNMTQQARAIRDKKIPDANNERENNETNEFFRSSPTTARRSQAASRTTGFDD